MPEPINRNSSEKGQPSGAEDIFDFEQKGGAVAPEQRPAPETTPRPERRVEAEPQPERTPERGPAEPQSREDERAQRQSAPAPAAAQPAPKPKDPALVEIESVLSEHLDEIFMQMTPQQQMAFQQKGEETAQEINTLLHEAKVKVRRVLDVIRSWLQMIPGVNKFFIEQEAKIKTDRLLNWREQQNKQP